MKTMILIPLFLSILLIGNYSLPDSSHTILAEKGTPSYAKWGRIAMQKTMEKYPNVDILDYLHIGRETGAETSTEKFKLWVRHNDKEFGVYIHITFNNQTEQIIDITFKETTRSF